MASEHLFEVGRRTFDTPEFRGITCIEVEARSIINRVPGTSMPFDWSINPYRGCTHACVYCFARPTHRRPSPGGPRFTRPTERPATPDQLELWPR